MSTHSDVEETLIKNLTSRDFPAASILRDPQFETAYGNVVARPDLVVVEPGSTEPLAIFEIKSQLDDRKHHKYLIQVGAYSDLFPSVPTYLVTSGSGESGFEVRLFERKSREFRKISAQELPSHADLVEISRAAEVVGRRSSRTRASEQLKRICWCLAFVCAALGVIDFVWESKEILNSSRLAVLGVVVGLVILPFAQRLKLLGFEYERITVKPSKESNGA